MLTNRLTWRNGCKNMNKLMFWMQGQPIGKGRPRFTRTGRAYTPAKTKKYEHALAARASDEMVSLGIDPISAPCKVYILAQFEIPKSWSKRRKEAATLGVVKPGMPDIDNIAKIVLDAINGVCFDDDKQVYELRATKRYGDPLVLVQIEWEQHENNNTK